MSYQSEWMILALVLVFDQSGISAFGILLLVEVITDLYSLRIKYIISV